jgi:hypothetical protein
MKNDTVYFVYDTTNLINGKKYRGIHKTSNINDGYLGSGWLFNIALKKHGKENFIKEILEYCNSYDELIEKEKIYVDENWVKDKSNYNLKTGGQSFGILSDESKNKISETLKRKYKSGEIIASIGDYGRGIPVSEEMKKKISNTMKERYKHQEHHLVGTTQSDETKKKRSDSLKNRYKNKNNIHPRTGKEPWNKGKIGVQVNINKGKKMEKIECPYCGKMIDLLNGKRWHFENCKLKPRRSILMT